MTRLDKQKIYQTIIQENSIASPILNKHFKYVFVGMVLNKKIEKARRKTHHK